MWLLYNVQTGAQIGDLLESEPTPAAGQAAVMVPGSALAGVTAWSAAQRGFVEVPLVDGPRMGAMLTWAEINAMAAHPDAAIRAIPLQWLLMIAFGRPQRVNSPLHIDTANALLAGGVLTTARHAQFLAGDPAP
jgi:hypothetical protein